MVRYVSGTPLAGDPGDHFWFDENHPFPPPRWHRAWLAVWYPSTKHILVFGRFPEPLRVGWTKGTHDFWGNFWAWKQASVGLVSWLVAPYRSRTKMAIGDTVQMVVWRMYLQSNMVMSGFYVKFWGVPLLQVRTSMVSQKSKDLLRNTSQVCCIPKQEAYVCLVNS